MYVFSKDVVAFVFLPHRFNWFTFLSLIHRDTAWFRCIASICSALVWNQTNTVLSWIQRTAPKRTIHQHSNPIDWKTLGSGQTRIHAHTHTPIFVNVVLRGCYDKFIFYHKSIHDRTKDRGTQSEIHEFLRCLRFLPLLI